MVSSSNEQTICNGNLFYVQCLANQYISITKAWYGRNDTQTCLSFAYANGCAACNTTCYVDVTTILQRYLNGRKSLTLSLSQITTTDPCYGTV